MPQLAFSPPPPPPLPIFQMLASWGGRTGASLREAEALPLAAQMLSYARDLFDFLRATLRGRSVAALGREGGAPRFRIKKARDRRKIEREEESTWRRD